ncbi:MAG: hypothetical protein HC804_03990 [Anaerolineae bacterium]|nr:hypothetical protein [Anaerolineae bacterium]
MQQDSVLGSLNEPRTLHRYTYSFNNPVNYTDPSGHTGVNEQTSQTPLTYNPSTSGSQGGNSPYTPHNNPTRSANQGKPTAYSDPVARQQSEGFRPSLCGFLTDLGETIVDVADHLGRASQELQQFVGEYGRCPCGLYSIQQRVFR